MTITIDWLPDELVETIFLNLEDANSIKSCLLVCKRWNQIIDNPEFWLRICLKQGKLNINQIYMLRAHDAFAELKTIYFLNPFNRNLLKNPCGHLGFRHWCSADDFPVARSFDFGRGYENYIYDENEDEIFDLDDLADDPDDEDDFESLSPSDFQNMISNYAKKFNKPYPSKWCVEEQIGTKQRLFDTNKRLLKNFATSNVQSGKMQIIDMENLKQIHRMMKHLLGKQLILKIRVSEFYAPRFSFSSRYKLIVLLVNEGFELVDKLVFKRVLRAQKSWQCVEHDFVITQPIKYVIYYHGGRDNICRHGFYGCKMTNSTVQLLI